MWALGRLWLLLLVVVVAFIVVIVVVVVVSTAGLTSMSSSASISPSSVSSVDLESTSFLSDKQKPADIGGALSSRRLVAVDNNVELSSFKSCLLLPVLVDVLARGCSLSVCVSGVLDVLWDVGLLFTKTVLAAAAAELAS